MRANLALDPLSSNNFRQTRRRRRILHPHHHHPRRKVESPFVCSSHEPRGGGLYLTAAAGEDLFSGEQVGNHGLLLFLSPPFRRSLSTRTVRLSLPF